MTGTLRGGIIPWLGGASDIPGEEKEIHFWQRLKSRLRFSRSAQTETVEPDRRPTAVRLNATSETALSNDLRALAPGQRGWISLDDAARLFSPTHQSQWDEPGLRALREFAAQIGHRSTPERNEREQRVYFTRIRTANI
jgi:hypothetical protein